VRERGDIAIILRVKELNVGIALTIFIVPLFEVNQFEIAIHFIIVVVVIFLIFQAMSL
jgi:hypothetical protein